MRILFYLICIILTGMECIGQAQDTYQPAAIYKQANIRSRAMMFNYSPHQTSTVDYFDHEGLLTEHIEFDTIKGQYWRRTVFRYDSSQNLLNGTVYLFARYNKVKKQYEHLTIPDTLQLQFEYDVNNQLIRKTEVAASGKILYQAAYFFNPLRRNEHFDKPDSISKEIFTEYESPNVDKKQVVVIHSAGKTQTCTYIYKNSFDKQGKIKRRTMERECDSEGGEAEKPYFRTYEFQYMSNGLLMSRISSDRTDDDRWKSGQLFDYKFW